MNNIGSTIDMLQSLQAANAPGLASLHAAVQSSQVVNVVQQYSAAAAQALSPVAYQALLLQPQATMTPLLHATTMQQPSQVLAQYIAALEQHAPAAIPVPSAVRMSMRGA